MTVYAPSDVRAVTIPSHFGGCGQAHEALDLNPGERWGLDCPECEAALTRAPLNSHGWAVSVDKVSLTPDERALLDSQEKEGSAATAMMVRQLGDTLAQAMRHGYSGMSGQPAPAPQFMQPSADDIVAALKSRPQEELAELLQIAGLVPSTPAEVVAAPPVAAKKAAAATKATS